MEVPIGTMGDSKCCRRLDELIPRIVEAPMVDMGDGRCCRWSKVLEAAT